jgi:hypothetical protein
MFIIAAGGDAGVRSTILQIDPDTGAEVEVPVDRAGCQSVAALSPQAISGGVRLVRSCDATGQRRISIVELDLGTGQLHELVPDIGFPAHSFGTPDGGQTWFAADSSGICAWVSRVSGDGDPWPITITDGRRPFVIDEGFAGTCDGLGMASHIAIDESGAIAFVASPEALEVSGAARTNVRWNVYQMDPGDVKPTMLAQDFVRPTDLRWDSSTGSILLAAAKAGRAALWSVARDGASKVVVDARVTKFAREPGGSTIAVIIRVGEEVQGRTQLLLWNPTGGPSD